MRQIKEFLLRRERGALEVEGLIIMTMMIFLLVFLLSFGFLFYQQWVVSFTANDTATRIAQSYAYPNTDPVMGYINQSMKSSISPFRYLGSHLSEGNKDKGETYATWCLKTASLSYAEGEPRIIVQTIYDDFARRHIVVDITARYEIPFGGALEFFGFDGHVTYHATGRAVCQDLSDYVIGVQVAKSLTGETFGSKIVGTYNSVVKLIENAKEYFGGDD